MLERVEAGSRVGSGGRTDDVWHLPRLSAVDFGFIRSPGAGLGNLLFPIGRALVGQKRHGGTFVYPTMRQLKLGPLLRRERDPRIYGDVLRGRTMADWRDWAKAHLAGRLAETAFDGSQRCVAVTYSGLGRYFHDLASEKSLVAEWLASNMRQAPLRADYDIAIHLRLGDFIAGAADRPTYSVRQEGDWYRSALEHARRELGTRSQRIVVFTDEPATARGELKMPFAEIDESRSAVAAILRMAQARIIVTSRSTFSMWGVFLGNALAIWDRRFDVAKSFPLRPGLDLIH